MLLIRFFQRGGVKARCIIDQSIQTAKVADRLLHQPRQILQVEQIGLHAQHRIGAQCVEQLHVRLAAEARADVRAVYAAASPGCTALSSS